MTVTNSTYRADYTGNGSTVDFTVPFYFLDTSHIQVLLTVIATGVATTLTLNSDYTVTGAGVSAGGTVTTTATYTSSYKITILRDVPYTQETHYVENDPFPAASHEKALDLLTMQNQQQAELLTRAFIAPSSGTVTDLTLPTPTAGYVLGWDGTGTGIVNVVSGAGSGAALQADLASTASAAVGDGMVGVKQPFTPSIATTQHEFNARTLYARDFGTDISSTITAMGATATTVIVDSPITVSADATVPYTLAVEFKNGGYLTIASGKVLTINGSFIAPVAYIFRGAGTVKFGPGSNYGPGGGLVEAYPQWWGAVADGNRMAQTGTDNGPFFSAASLSLFAANSDATKKLKIPPGTYNIATMVSLQPGTNFEGSGWWNTTLLCATTLVGSCIETVGALADLITISNLNMIASNYSANGIVLKKNGGIVQNVYVSGFGKAIVCSTSDNLIDNFIIEQSAVGLFIDGTQSSYSNGSIWGNGTAIYIANNVNPDPAGTTVLSNIRCGENGVTGIRIDGGKRVSISNCDVDATVRTPENPGMTSYGLQISSSTEINICNFSANQGAATDPGFTGQGIYVSNSSEINLTNVKAIKWLNGIVLNTVTDCNISGAITRGNAATGLLVNGSSTRNTISQVVAVSNGSDGIQFNGGSQNVITDCQTISNSGYGVRFVNTSDINYTHNIRGNANTLGEYSFAAFTAQVRHGANVETYGTAMPTTGTWTQGDKVWNTTPTNAAGQAAGWLRVTTGSGNVLNTDWRVYGVTT